MRSTDGKASLILTLVNTVVILAAAGLMVYTRLLFQRPAITEDNERIKLSELLSRPKGPAAAAHVDFEQMTANIAPTPSQPQPANGHPNQIMGKLHYATIAFSLEIRDGDRKDEIEKIRPLILDKLLSILGHKTFQELNNVQGRYVLRNQIIDAVNQLLEKANPASAKKGLVSNLYFSQFQVQ
jgi:flagellar FliL protein